jgi:hypothetical protein
MVAPAGRGGRSDTVFPANAFGIRDWVPVMTSRLVAGASFDRSL